MSGWISNCTYGTSSLYAICCSLLHREMLRTFRNFKLPSEDCTYTCIAVVSQWSRSTQVYKTSQVKHQCNDVCPTAEA